MVPPEVSVLPLIEREPDMITLPDTNMEPETIGLSIIIFSFVYKYFREG